jgi:peroxiredoxin
LSDIDRAVGSVYGVARSPDEQYPDFPKRMTFLINPEGRVKKIYEVADAGAHPQIVLDELRQIATSA